MTLDHNDIRRLAFIKHLLGMAVSQSRAPEPLSSASLLTFHDAVELFLQLASEHLNAGGERLNFMEYWGAIKQSGKELSQQESMRRLNKARVALKHHGNLPSRLDIEAFRASATSFFEENTPNIFGITLSEVSLVEFVQPEKAREMLKEAQTALERNEVGLAIEQIAISFVIMVDDYEARKRNSFGRSPFFFGKDLAFHDSFFMGLKGNGREFDKLGEFVDRVKDSIEAIQEAVKMMALGIDYRRYSRFKLLTPPVTKWPTIGVKRERSTAQVTREDADFCFDFVIEMALTLLEFDYSVSVSAPLSSYHSDPSA